MFARFLLLPQPALRHLVGASIPGCAHACDPYGFALCAATLDGGGWTAHHNDIKYAFYNIAREAGLHTAMENTALFLSGLTRAQVLHLPEEFYERGRGYIPDLQIRLRDTDASPPRLVDRLFDIKTLHVRQNPEHPEAYTAGMTVDRRAEAVHRTIELKMRKADQRFFGTPTLPSGALGDGPLTLKLNSFGKVGGLVFGGIGEASREVQLLVDRLSDQAAQTMAIRKGRVHLPQAQAEARAFNRERVAMANLKGMAELLLNRVEHLTLPGAVRRESQDPRRFSHTDWRSAFDHMSRAASHAERERIARRSNFSRSR